LRGQYPAGEVTGASIATLQTIVGAPPGNVNLIAPRGREPGSGAAGRQQQQTTLGRPRGEQITRVNSIYRLIANAASVVRLLIASLS
jgi:hypothetical protein